MVEIPAVEPSGEGEHLLVRLRKRNLDTLQAARKLARAAGVPARAVSFAGLKDRHAVTEQHFSIHLPGRADPDLSAVEDDRLQVLEVVRHHRKLRRGALAGNRFLIRVREFEGDRARTEARLERIAQDGVPNYFGSQRFGREGRNLEQAQALFQGRAGRIGREQRGLLLSAARAHLFNRVLAVRVEQRNWNLALPGEVLQIDGRQAQFHAPLDDLLAARVAAGEVHPTGPLWGRPGRALVPEEEAGEVERRVLEKSKAWREGLERAGLEMDRRALRLPVRELVWQWAGEDLLLSFRLGKGGYATAVLRELCR